jgi:hypothetical protein
MLITIELENAIDHLFRGEELLPSAEESLKEMDFESLAQGIKFFSKPVYVYTAYPDGDPDGGYRGPLLFPFPATLLYSKTYEEIICDSGVIIKHSMELWILDDMTFAAVSCVRVELENGEPISEYRGLKTKDRDISRRSLILTITFL